MTAINIKMCFVHSEHCIVEYNGDAVVMYPKAALCSVDGIPISEPTRLPQGINYSQLKQHLAACLL